jgi:radical SAM protein with 4Fe4S-binding SPASM domain
MIEGFGQRVVSMSMQFPSLEMDFAPRPLDRFLTAAMPEIALKQMEVSIFIDNKFFSDYEGVPNNMEMMSKDLIESLVDRIFRLANKNDFSGIYFKLFACEKESLTIATDIFRQCRVKGIKYFIEVAPYIFSDWKEVDLRLIKELRQITGKMVLPLDGVGSFYENIGKIKRSFNEVKRVISLVKKEKFPLFVIIPVTGLNLGNIEKTVSFLSSERVPFAFYFCDENIFSGGKQKKLDRSFFKAYKLISKNGKIRNIFSNLFGRNFSLSSSRKDIPYAIYYQKKGSLVEETFLENPRQEFKDCAQCQFKELCLKSFPLRVGYLSQKKDNLSTACSFYKRNIPIFIKKELERSVLNKKWKIFNVQWHITERCNWRCKFCYQSEHPTPDLSYEELCSILDKYVSLIDRWKLHNERARLVLTGGEPLVRSDFFKFLEYVNEKRKKYGFRCSILSNGSLLDEEKVIRLKELGIKSYQVSMEGMKEKTDDLMGQGCFDKAVRAIKLLVAQKVPAVVSFTMTKKNVGELMELAEFCIGIGANTIGARRLIPWGRGKDLEENMLSPEELKDIYIKIKEKNKEFVKRGLSFRIGIGCETGIFNEDILGDPDSDMPVNLCGLTLGRCITIMANGDLMNCRRLPITMGNALKDDLYDFWYSKPMRDLRDMDKIDPKCKKCDNFTNCFGGARCVTYAYSGKLNAKDVQCWR